MGMSQASSFVVIMHYFESKKNCSFSLTLNNGVSRVGVLKDIEGPFLIIEGSPDLYIPYWAISEVVFV